MPLDPVPSARPGAFPETRWTLILRAGQSDEARRAALSELITPRWNALYALARKKGLPRERAEDAVQSFVERLLKGDAIEALDPERGRLRSYLAAAFSRHLINLHEYDSARKRGDAKHTLPLDAVEALVAASNDSPERIFDRAFAVAQFQAALSDLRAEFAAGERSGPFEILERIFRFGESEPYPELALRYGLSVPQLKSLVHRSKRRFQQLFRARIAETVDEPNAIDAELSFVIGLLGGE